MTKRKTLKKSLATKIKARDKHLCRVCRVNDISEIHHKQPVYLGGTDESYNLIGLCGSCHALAPDSEHEFRRYKAEGGRFWNLIGVGISIAKMYPGKSDRYLKKQAMRWIQKVKKSSAQFEKNFNNMLKIKRGL